jgi:hypothetical protein
MSGEVTAAVVAAAVSVGTTLLTKLWLDRRAHRQARQVDYEFEQRKALQTLIGRHHGRLLDAATSWHYRMSNIYANAERGWLSVEGDYKRPGYYFRSTVFRFLALEAQAHAFEREQIFIDARVVESHDLDFVKFVKALHWVLSDAALFAGLEYDAYMSDDHIFSDRVRALAEAFLQEDGTVPSFRTFESYLRSDETQSRMDELAPAFEFLDGASASEPRLRWDRLVCLHLLAIAFTRCFGYEWVKPSQGDIRNAVDRIQHPLVAANLINWLPRLGLAGHPALTETVRELQRRAKEA